MVTYKGEELYFILEITKPREEIRRERKEEGTEEGGGRKCPLWFPFSLIRTQGSLRGCKEVITYCLVAWWVSALGKHLMCFKLTW